MIRINCPFCGERDHSEFSYGGDASIEYPELDASAEQWHDAVYMRENIRGMQAETWFHQNGCRLWLVVERDTVTHHIKSVRAAHQGYAKALASSVSDQDEGAKS
ncbi:MAG: heterotetrameric sarcosine oxidase delta subunit [Cryomorphaceae bacterium]|jgi:heterotetrameric sarcosine oxidase delta subunit